MRTRHFVYGFTLLLLASLVSPSHAADPRAGPSAFVAELVQKGLLSLTTESTSSADRQRRLGEFLDEDFDVPRIAGFVVGHYWQTATEAERQSFTSVFHDFLVRVYSQRFNDYDGASFKVIGQHVEDATSTVVFTEMSQPSSGQAMRVEWRVVDRSGYRIIDISAGGVSLAKVQREDFMSALRRNGGSLSNLVQQLQEKVAMLDSH